MTQWAVPLLCIFLKFVYRSVRAVCPTFFSQWHQQVGHSVALGLGALTVTWRCRSLPPSAWISSAGGRSDPWWPAEDGLEVLKQCHEQVVCWMPNTYFNVPPGKQAHSKKRARKQRERDLQEDRHWWESDTWKAHTHFCNRGEWRTAEDCRPLRSDLGILGSGQRSGYSPGQVALRGLPASDRHPWGRCCSTPRSPFRHWFS